MKTKATLRIYENTKLIGITAKKIEESFDVNITKVERGEKASDNKYITLKEADYITIEGNSRNVRKAINECLALLGSSRKEVKK